eukprot:gene24081-30385_t
MGGGFGPYGGGGMMFPGGMYGGMMMSGMMGHPGAGGGMMNFLCTMNYFVSMASQAVYFLGMNSHRIVDAVKTAKAALVNLEKIVRQSEFRRWMQRKSKKSVILRYLFVFMSAVLAHQLTNIAKYAFEHYMTGRASLSTPQRTIAGQIASSALSASSAPPSNIAACGVSIGGGGGGVDDQIAPLVFTDLIPLESHTADTTNGQYSITIGNSSLKQPFNVHSLSICPSSGRMYHLIEGLRHLSAADGDDENKNKTKNQSNPNRGLLHPAVADVLSNSLTIGTDNTYTLKWNGEVHEIDQIECDVTA